MTLGETGEAAACRFLERQNYRVQERNFRCRAGEIDIIAIAPDGTIVFAEVKTRQTLTFGLPCESVTAEKRMHLRRAAEVYISCRRLQGRPCRFDILEILIRHGSCYIRHLENAFQEE